MTLEEVLPLLVPLIVLQVALIALALWDLAKPERRVRGESKLMWALIIVFFELFGPILYFLVGRRED